MTDLYEKSTGAHRGYVKVYEPEYLASLRRPLVAHGFKCPDGCGATLVPTDPLPHRCQQPSFGIGDYGRCLL